jgi:uncharacterized membrane protein YdjX (TVP38/TMEM64 family)
VAVSAYAAWLVWTDAPAYGFAYRLFHDNQYMKDKLVEWGAAAPVIFIAIQALQVIIAPIPGEVTGILGGFVFGQWLGLVYSTIGLTIGSLAAFALGRWLGDAYVRNLVSEETWNKLGFIVEAEGTILCFIIYLIPGLPKDIICYLSGSRRCRSGSLPWFRRSAVSPARGCSRPRVRKPRQGTTSRCCS